MGLAAAQVFRATGRDVSAHVDRLFGHSLAHGQGPGATLLEEVLDDGTVVKSSCRTWPYTEAVKAAVAEHEAGRPDMEPLIAGWLDTMLERHLSRAFEGGWVDQVSAEGEPMVDFAPASTLYHAGFAIAEVERVFGSCRLGRFSRHDAAAARRSAMRTSADRIFASRLRSA